MCGQLRYKPFAGVVAKLGSNSEGFPCLSHVYCGRPEPVRQEMRSAADCDLCSPRPWKGGGQAVGDGPQTAQAGGNALVRWLDAIGVLECTQPAGMPAGTQSRGSAYTKLGCVRGVWCVRFAMDRTRKGSSHRTDWSIQIKSDAILL